MGWCPAAGGANMSNKQRTPPDSSALRHKKAILEYSDRSLDAMNLSLDVVLRESLGHGANLFQRARTVHQQAFFFVRSMVPFDIAVQIGATRRQDIGLHPHTQQKLTQR